MDIDDRSEHRLAESAAKHIRGYGVQKSAVDLY